jgi:hypothetical protein
MNTDEIDPRLLSDLRALREVADDLRLDPPPLPDVRRRAGRRHRARLVRNAAGGVAGLVAAGVLAAALLPTPWAPGGGTERLDRVQLAGTVMPKPDRAQACVGSATPLRELPAGVLLLPAPDPAGFRLTSVRSSGWGRGCSYPALTAWHVDAASSRVDRRVQIYAGTPYVDTPAVKAMPGAGRCAHLAAEDQPGRCVTLVVGGRERPVWLWDSKRTDWGDGQVLTWLDGGYLWQLSEFGLGDAALKDFVAGIRTYADGVLTGSLPGGFQAWQPPADVPGSEGLTASYTPLRGDPSDIVGVFTSNGPADGPFRGFLMHATGNSPAGQPRAVDVDGHQGIWSVDPVTHRSSLIWSLGDGVSVSLFGPETLGLDQALRIARSMHPVRRDDPRLVEPQLPIPGTTPGAPTTTP